jgi:nitrite reductase (NO-forming)
VIGEIFDAVDPEGAAEAAHQQATLVPAGGAAVADFQGQVAGDHVLVDHSLSRLARGAFGVLRVAGEKNAAIFQPVSSSMKAALPSGH